VGDVVWSRLTMGMHARLAKLLKEKLGEDRMDEVAVELMAREAFEGRRRGL